MPLDSPEQIAESQDVIFNHMTRHGIEPVLVDPTDFADITPRWGILGEPSFRYILSSDAIGEATVELLPVKKGSKLIGVDKGIDVVRKYYDDRMTYHLPQDVDSLVLPGASPLHPGKVCVYEAFLDIDILEDPFVE